MPSECGFCYWMKPVLWVWKIELEFNFNVPLWCNVTCWNAKEYIMGSGDVNSCTSMSGSTLWGFKR